MSATTTTTRATCPHCGKAFLLTPEAEQPKPPPVVETQQPTGIIVSPTGHDSAPGTTQQPISLQAALATAKPGAVYLLRGGVYRGSFVSSASGAKDAPIVFRAAPGEHPTLDGAGQTAHTLLIQGAHVHFYNLEITNSAVDRIAGSPTCVSAQAEGIRVVNCILHDAGQGVFANQQAVDFELYGCIIFNHGWQGAPPDRPHGHGVYIQNATGTKRIVDNIVFNNYGWGIHAYGQGAELRNIHLEGNTVFGSGALARVVDGTVQNVAIGGYKPADGIELRSNVFYFPLDSAAFNTQFFYLAENNGALSLRDNYFAGGVLGIEARSWQRIDGGGNTVVGKVYLARLVPAASGAIAWDNNAYFHLRDDPHHAPFSTGSEGWTWSDWQKVKGFDESGRYTRVASATSIPNHISVRPNKYESGRAHVAVVNWSRQASVSVDLSAVLKSGEKFEVRNVVNLSSPILTGVFNGKAVSLPTPQEVNAFLVRRTQ